MQIIAFLLYYHLPSFRLKKISFANHSITKVNASFLLLTYFQCCFYYFYNAELLCLISFFYLLLVRVEILSVWEFVADTVSFVFLVMFKQAFVENNPAIKWCPTAGCERAVRLTRQGSSPSGADTLSFPLLRAPAVDCGKGHLFCWLV